MQSLSYYLGNADHSVHATLYALNRGRGITGDAHKASVHAGDRLTPQERKALLDGFRRLRPPYTCPHGRPIITELTQRQMEKSFRRIQ